MHGLTMKFLSLPPGATTPIGGCILQPSSGLLASSRTRFLDHIKRRATVGRVIILQSIRRKLYKIFTSRLLYKARNPRGDKQPRLDQLVDSNRQWRRGHRRFGYTFCLHAVEYTTLEK